MYTVLVPTWLYMQCVSHQGITYDTGGADIKAGGIMAGMHRDKCGAAFVAGFFKVGKKYVSIHYHIVTLSFLF